MTTHQLIIQLTIAYTLVGAFVFTVVITCCSLPGWVKFADKKQQQKLVAAIIIEVIVIGLTFFGDFLTYNPKEATKAALSDTRELQLIRPLLSDIINETLPLSYFAQMSHIEIENELGKTAGWTSQIKKRMGYIQGSVSSITSNDGFPLLPSESRRYFASNNARMETYKVDPILKADAILQQSKHLILHSIHTLLFIDGIVINKKILSRDLLNSSISHLKESEVDKNAIAIFIKEYK